MYEGYTHAYTYIEDNNSYLVRIWVEIIFQQNVVNALSIVNTVILCANVYPLTLVSHTVTRFWNINYLDYF